MMLEILQRLGLIDIFRETFERFIHIFVAFIEFLRSFLSVINFNFITVVKNVGVFVQFYVWDAMAFILAFGVSEAVFAPRNLKAKFLFVFHSEFCLREEKWPQYPTCQLKNHLLQGDWFEVSK